MAERPSDGELPTDTPTDTPTEAPSDADSDGRARGGIPRRWAPAIAAAIIGIARIVAAVLHAGHHPQPAPSPSPMELECYVRHMEHPELPDC